MALADIEDRDDGPAATRQTAAPVAAAAAAKRRDGGARRRSVTALALATVVAAMVGLAFASVPLYRLFCQVTGYGGTPRTDVTALPSAVSDRSIAVRFDANVNAALPWRFAPGQRRIDVRLGVQTLIHYEAVNDSTEPVTGTAIFNVSPFKAAIYFNKIECFCFTEQTLAPGQRVAMPVSFFVDPAIADDPDTRDVAVITLSYTFYPAESGEDDPPARGSAATGGPVAEAGQIPVPMSDPARPATGG